MRTSRGTVLGIEIGPDEIRLVEVRGGSPPQITRIGAVPLPADALDGARIVLVDAVANLIRGLTNRLNCQSKTAVFGIGLHSVITRVMQIPPVPASEIRVVIEGELAHFHILRTGMGAFDLCNLGAAPGGDGLQSVLVMAVDQRIAKGYRQVAEKAGLELLALEPISPALYRPAFPTLQSGPEMMCLILTTVRSELAIVSHGDIRLYRRLEIGSDDFISGRIPQHSVGHSPVDLTVADEQSHYGADRFFTLPPTEVAASEGAAGVDTLPTEEAWSEDRTPKRATDRVWALAEELQRSIEFYRREYPSSEPLSRLMIATNDPDSIVIEPILRQHLHLDVRMVELPARTTSMVAPDGSLTTSNSFRFLGAYGLALQPLTPEWRQCPQFDLTPNEPSTLRRADRDRLTALVAAGLIILVTGLIAGRVFAKMAESEVNKLGLNRVLLENKRRITMERDAQIAQERALLTIVRSDNLPVGTLIKILIGRLPAGVSLRSVDIQRTGHVVIEGEASSNQVFAIFYDRLQTCPQFVGSHYTQLITNEVNHLTQFRIESSVIGTQDAVVRSHS